MTWQVATPEFRVNTTTEGYQGDSSIAPLSDGRFVVTWQDNSGDGSGSTVRARIFSATNTPEGPDFVVPTTTSGDQGRAIVTELANGGFVVTWTDTSGRGTSSEFDVRARIYGSDGLPSGADFIVNGTTTGIQQVSSVTALADGNFVVAWEDTTALRGQIFDASGSRVGSEFDLNTTPSYSFPTVVPLADGGFVAAWTHVVSNGMGDVRIRLFMPDGTPAGAEIAPNSTHASWVAVSPLGDGFVVTWTEQPSTGGSDTQGASVHAQIYGAHGIASGLPFVVNTSAVGDQFSSTVNQLADGRFLITWSDGSGSLGATDDSWSIHGQIFSADGLRSGTEFLINTLSGTQYDSAVTALADGRFIVAWDDTNPAPIDATNDDIRAAIFDPTHYDGTAANEVVIGGTLADYISGNGGDDTLKGAGGGDTLYGSDGNDTLEGGAGADALVGGQGFDFISYQGAATGVAVDLIYSQYSSGDAAGDSFSSIEAIVGSEYNDGLFGSDGNDVIYGGAGNDVIYGRGGNDAILGTGGDDTMVGGTGNDTLYGDQGSGVDHDTFVFEAGNFGHDIIQGFGANSGSNHDLIQMDHGNFANFSDLMAHAAQFGTDVIIDNGTASIQLVAVSLASLTADDFTFT